MSAPLPAIPPSALICALPILSPQPSLFPHDQENNSRSNRPERRTALVARTLARCKLDIAALSETQFSEQSQLEKERPPNSRMTRRWYRLCHPEGHRQILMFSAMLMDAYRNMHPGISIVYRTDGHLINSRRMQASTRVSTTKVHDLLFADDCALNTVTEEDVRKGAWTLRRRLRQLWINHQYSQTGGHATTAAELGIQCSPNK
ncbi:unnamed protein product [Schistocephalus solidus]|uniref:Reverse transcriptase domain-containing protein n=1 Tax=Schistocephalus solidus TaxID=70667 RepID=A0A183TQJ6_SCHSO|nr:unnamed protein product [Schistocephalus solidus]